MLSTVTASTLSIIPIILPLQHRTVKPVAHCSNYFWVGRTSLLANFKIFKKKNIIDLVALWRSSALNFENTHINIQSERRNQMRYIIDLLANLIVTLSVGLILLATQQD